jgi:hypothetical protein
MRFSIVYDDNGTILSASEEDYVTDGPLPGPGENVAHFDIPDDLPDAGLHEAVERLLVDVDPRKLTRRTGSKGGLTMVQI